MNKMGYIYIQVLYVLCACHVEFRRQFLINLEFFVGVELVLLQLNIIQM